MKNFIQNTPTVLIALVLINAVMFLFSQMDNELMPEMALFFFENPEFRPWQILSHMFMHGGFIHIFINMFALVTFGATLVYIWGNTRFLIFFFACGLGAAFVHTLMNYYFFNVGVNELGAFGFSSSDIVSILSRGQYYTQWTELLSKSTFDNMMSSFMVPVVGASGAIYGLLLAYAVMFPDAELMFMFIPKPIKAKFMVPALLSLDLVGGMTGGFNIFGGSDGIAHFAHLGGALTGFILTMIWKKRSLKSQYLA